MPKTKEEKLEDKKQYYIKNRTRLLEKQKNYYKNNPSQRKNYKEKNAGIICETGCFCYGFLIVNIQ